MTFDDTPYVFEKNATEGNPSSVISRNPYRFAHAATILFAINCELHVRIKQMGREIKRTCANGMPGRSIFGPTVLLFAVKFTTQTAGLQKVVELMPILSVLGRGGSRGIIIAHLGLLSQSPTNTGSGSYISSPGRRGTHKGLNPERLDAGKPTEWS